MTFYDIFDQNFMNLQRHDEMKIKPTRKKNYSETALNNYLMRKSLIALRTLLIFSIGTI